jgi:hypothetical protein
MARWTVAPSSPLFYVVYSVVIVLVLKEVNSVVWDPYMVSPYRLWLHHVILNIGHY